ncbi:MAG: hypothetical protein HYR84_17045 [Planctomycetes bacterium]|nr:hypothetical protein [Planctomycetota bacterium]
MMFADGLFGLSENVLFIIRIIASVAGALVGWFIADPLGRVFYRTIYGGETPGSFLLGSRIIGAAIVGLLVFLFLPLGGGGGLGLGPGLGGGPGKGKGDGGDKSNSATDPAKDKTPKGIGPQIDVIDIHIIRRDDYKEEDKRCYLLRDSKEAKTLAQVEDYLLDLVGVEITKRDANIENQTFRIAGSEKAIAFQTLAEKFKERSPRIEVRPIMHEDSIGRGKKDNPWDKLVALSKAYGLGKAE